VRIIRIGLVVALLALAACGGGAGDTTTTAGGEDDGGATTTAADDSGATTTTAEDDGGQVVGVDDIPQECMDAFIAFLKDIEPLVEPVDWENATTEDLEELGTALEPLTEQYEGELGAGCEDIQLEGTDEEQFAFMIEVAEREAPGAVGYFEWIRDFATGIGEGPEASGDCETDIAAMQAIVDEGLTISELPMSELTAVGNLMTSIAMVCPPERSAEFFAKEDVAAFTESSG
jgi:hypothetical protein